MKYIHIIVGLNIGGAENTLLKYLRSLDSINEHCIISLTSNGELLSEFRELDIQIFELGMRKNLTSVIKGIGKLYKLIENSTTIIAWMYHATLLSILIKILKSDVKLISNIRHSDVGMKNNKIVTFLIIRFIAFASKEIDLITYNGNLAEKNHTKLGYKTSKIEIVENAVDTNRFNRNNVNNIEVDQIINQYNLKNKKVILAVSRYNPIKGINELVDSLYIFKNELKVSDFIMILVGKGLDSNNRELLSLIEKRNLSNEIVLVGETKRVELYYSLADIFVLPSLSEAFPNVMLEALSSELVCISTKVGEVDKLLEAEYLCEPGDIKGLAKLMYDSIYLGEDDISYIGLRNREKIIEDYSISKVMKRYHKLFRLG